MFFGMQKFPNNIKAMQAQGEKNIIDYVGKFINQEGKQQLNDDSQKEEMVNNLKHFLKYLKD